jgi:hypothetical protein
MNTASGARLKTIRFRRMAIAVLVKDTQPPNFAMFVHEYNLRPFDGRSDECLKATQTWPASWSEQKSL